MEKLLALLKQVRSDVDFEKELSLIDDGVLDSIDVLAIVNGIKSEFGVEMSIADIDPDDFNSAETMFSLISRMKGC